MVDPRERKGQRGAVSCCEITVKKESLGACGWCELIFTSCPPGTKGFEGSRLCQVKQRNTKQKRDFTLQSSLKSLSLKVLMLVPFLNRVLFGNDHNHMPEIIVIRRKRENEGRNKAGKMTRVPRE